MESPAHHRHPHHVSPFEDHPPPRYGKRRLSLSLRQRNILSTGVMIIGLILFTEISSWLCFSFLEKQWMTYGKMYKILSMVQAAPTNLGRANPSLLNWEAPRVIHPYLGHVTPPTKRKENMRTHEQEFMEDYGFLSGSGPLMRERRPDSVIIGIFGGSVARHLLERGGTQAIASELKKLPEFANKNIVFSSAALYSYHQPQQLLALSYVLTLGATFDIVIEIDGFNEVDRWYAQGKDASSSPFYPYVWSLYMRLMEADPVLRLKMGDLAFRVERRGRMADLLRRTPLRWSMAASFLWRVYDQRAETAINLREAALLNYYSSFEESYAVRGPTPHYDSDDAYYLDRANTWEEGSRQMYKLTTGKGIRYFHFLQPNGYVSESKILTPTEKNLLYAWWMKKDIPAAYRLFRKAGGKLRAEGVNFTDLSAIYRNTQEDVFSDNCCHMNTLGNAILGRAIAAVIKQDLIRKPFQR